MKLRDIKITRPAPPATVKALAYYVLCYEIGEVFSKYESFIANGKPVKVSTLGATHYFNSRDEALIFCRDALNHAGYPRAAELPLC